MKKSGFLLIYQLLANLSLFSQINWISRPGNLQFYSRNLTNNRANVRINGNVVVAGYSSMGLKVTQNGKYYSNQTIFLNYSSGKASFNFDVVLPAGKYLYDFLVTIDSSGIQRTALSAKRIVVGDAYLISGQSNSVANAYVGLANPLYRDSFVRSFGNSAPNVSGVADSNWYIADGDGLYNAGSIGQWGLVLGKSILDSFGMPVCFINAGVGGTTIGFHQKNINNPTDISTNYGRMLLRATRAGFADKIRGVFWFQGESDGANASGHDTLFRKMYRDWLSDYKAIEKVYPVQVRSGCGSPSLILRDKQRMLKTLSKCTVLTGNGLNAHDGCHYGFTNGYETLGQQLFNIVKTDLYKGKRNENHYSPEPVYCYYANKDQTLLCLELNNLGATFVVDTLFHQLFKLEGSTSRITNGWIFKNKLYLKIDKSDCNLKGISYDGLAGNKPWVKTALGAAMLSFYNHPILKSAPLTTVKACRGNVVNLGRDSIPGVKYDWKGMTGGKTYNMAKPYHKADNSELFRLILTYGTSSCNMDTLWQTVIADTVSKIGLPDTVKFCFGDTILIGDRKSDWVNSAWYKDGKLASVGFYYRTYDTGNLLQIVTGLNGCQISDSVFLMPEKKYRDLLETLNYRCSGDSSNIQSGFIGKMYDWNGYESSSNTYKVPPGISKVMLVVIDSSGCRWHDSTQIMNLLPVAIPLEDEYQYCEGDSLALALPSTHRQYYLNGTAVNDKVVFKQPGSYTLSGKDSQGCKAQCDLQLIQVKKPGIKLRDSGFCKGEFIEITPAGLFDSYYWSHGYTEKTATFTKSGHYWLEVSDSNGCRNRDSFIISTQEKPIWQIASDTVICSGDSIEIEPYEENTKWFWNSIEYSGKKFKIKTAGRYEFTGYSSQFCSVKNSYRVIGILCQSGLNKIRKKYISIKACGNKVIAEGEVNSTFQVQIFDQTGRLVHCENSVSSRFEKEFNLSQNTVFFAILLYQSAEGLNIMQNDKLLLRIE